MSESTAKRMLGLYVEHSVKGLNLGTFYLACLIALLLFTFMPQVQPFLLTEFLNIPEENQGVVSGNLNFWAEIVIIVTAGLFGAMSDKLGRRVVFSLGFLIMGVAFWFYPRATGINELLMFRLIYAAGAAAVSVMMVTVVADYVKDRSRGKGTGYLGIMNGIGAMITAVVLVGMPSRLIAGGMTPVEAGLTTYSIVTGIAFAMALMTWFGLRKSDPEQSEERVSFARKLVEGFGAARNPGISLAYGASFVARGNFAVFGTFYVLWAKTYGVTELGMTAADAQAKAVAVIVITNMSALLGAPLFGILTDKVQRTTALMITLAIAFVGYAGTHFVVDPFAGIVFLFGVIIGLSEIGCVITSGVLIAEQTPVKIRGSVIGVFNLTGAVGILVASKAGGYLFDLWRPAGPFILFGFFALAVLLWTLAIRARVAPAPPAEQAA